MRILVSNPSLQYTRNTVKALLKEEHEVLFATAYWYNPERLFEKLMRFTPLKNYLKRYADPAIPSSRVINNFCSGFVHFLLKILPFSVEQKSFLEDRLHDKWVSGLVRTWKPQLTIGYEKSCMLTFAELDKLNAVKWLDLSQVHPDFIATLRLQFSFFKNITGTDSLFNKVSIIKKKEYELADRILCLSEFAVKTLTSSGISQHKTMVNPLGFDSAVFFPTSNNMAKNNRPLHIVYAGIITQRKGIHLLLEAVAGFPKGEVQFTLIGPAGDATPLLEKYLNNPAITYIPFLPQTQLAEQLREADVFVFPSYLDSWAAVVVEAMACGLPVIVTEHTGAAQIVSVQSGMVIPVNNKEAITGAIRFMIDHPDQRDAMAISAAKEALPFSWSRYNDQLNSMVHQVAQSYSYV